MCSRHFTIWICQLIRSGITLCYTCTTIIVVHCVFLFHLVQLSTHASQWLYEQHQNTSSCGGAYIYIYIYIYIYTHTHIYLHTYINTHVQMSWAKQVAIAYTSFLLWSIQFHVMRQAYTPRTLLGLRPCPEVEEYPQACSSHTRHGWVHAKFTIFMHIHMHMYVHMHAHAYECTFTCSGVFTSCRSGWQRQQWRPW